MAKSAYVILNPTGVVLRCHSEAVGNPTNNAGDLNTLIRNGFLAKREFVLDGGNMLVVLEKPA